MVEGESDEKALPILVRKIISSSPGLKILGPFGNRLLNPGEMGKHIKTACQFNPNINKVLLCIDSECTDIEETTKRFTPSQNSLQQTFPRLSLTYIVVYHSLESWLLQDREALRRLLGHNARLLKYSNPESNCRPAELLSDIFQANGRDYKKTVYAPHLARFANIDTIATGSPTFRTFQQAIKG